MKRGYVHSLLTSFRVDSAEEGNIPEILDTLGIKGDEIFLDTGQIQQLCYLLGFLAIHGIAISTLLHQDVNGLLERLCPRKCVAGGLCSRSEVAILKADKDINSV